MLDQLLFWDHKPGSRAVRVWTALILLSPLVLAGSLLLQRRVLASMPARIEIDREDAIEIAERFLEAHGVDVARLEPRVHTPTDMPVYRALASQNPAAVREVPYWGAVRVQFQEPGEGHGSSVQIDLKGRVLGFNLQLPDRPARPFPTDEARKLADSARAEIARQWPLLEFGKVDAVEPPQQSSGVPYRYAWPVTFRGVENVKGKLELRLMNGVVVEQEIHPEVEPEGHVDVGSLPKWMGGVPFALYIVVMVVYVVIRFIKRRIQKEVSRERMWMVAAVIAVLFTFTQYLGDAFLLRDEGGTMPWWLALILLTLMGFAMGIVGGMFYSACEGDLRESYPTLLTSLDAALCGRILSRNVGRAILLGVVAASWAFLLRALVYQAFRPPFAGTNSLEASLDFLFSKSPALAALLSTPGLALFLSLVALLSPLTLFAPRCTNPRRLYLLLGISAWFAVAMASGEPLPFVPLALTSAGLAAAMLWTFFTIDFLSSFTVLIAWQLFSLAGLAQVVPVWSRHDHWALLGGIAVTALAGIGVWRGRVVDATEVRPAYARDIQERMQLQSEVALAREAQQRLLPAESPSLTGLSIAAHCQPAEQVSGDFYDFYRVAPHRAAIFLSDGGGGGLATALAIALTKGYLMHKAEQGVSPVDALAGVAAMLGEELEGFSAEGLCYAVVDQRERSVRYARLGATPAVIRLGESAPVHEIRHDRAARPIYEGFFHLTPGQPLVLYTNGFSKFIGTRDAHSTHRWILKRMPDFATARLLERILDASGIRKNTARVVDDITLIVIAPSAEPAQDAERVA